MMQHRQLGRSGLSVSAIGLGCNNIGGRCDFAASRAVVHAALDHGITLFDTANVYPRGARGRSEEFLGQILGERRRDIVLATKVGIAMDGGRLGGASRATIMASVEESLRRLGTDYVDLCGEPVWMARMIPLLQAPIEIAFAIPCYMALVLATIRYWEIVLDNRL
jgi:aryl-alcohol dehydrogenase-like predicted oxidoreductase